MALLYTVMPIRRPSLRLPAPAREATGANPVSFSGELPMEEGVRGGHTRFETRPLPRRERKPEQPCRRAYAVVQKKFMSTIPVESFSPRSGDLPTGTRFGAAN